MTKCGSSATFGSGSAAHSSLLLLVAL